MEPNDPAALRHELAKDDVSFEFWDGECEAAADASKFVPSPSPVTRLRVTHWSALDVRELFDGPYLEYYPVDLKQLIAPQEQLAQAHELILTAIEEEGPFDGVMGFSQGAALAASILIHQALTRPLEPPYKVFRCAIFMCASLPWDYTGTVRLEPADVGTPIRIPTTHIVGCKDFFYQEGLRLYSMCEKDNAMLYDHRGSHMIPTDKKTTLAMAEAIRTTLHRASFVS